MRIFPYRDRVDAFVVEGDLGDKTYATATDASTLIRASRSKVKARALIIDFLKEEAEGYVLRFETTGIQDPQAANDAIRTMEGPEWSRRLHDWRQANPQRAAVRVARAARLTSVAPTEKRMVGLQFHIDTNRINARQNLHSMNNLGEWRRRGVVEIEMSEPAAAEAARGHDRARLRKAQGYIQTLTEIETDQERETRKRIQVAIFPEGVKDHTEENDVEIVFNSNKYGAILVTNDGGSTRQPGGILGARNRLADFGVRVVTDEDACRMVRDRIRTRDCRARQDAKEAGSLLPTWVVFPSARSGGLKAEKNPAA